MERTNFSAIIDAMTRGTAKLEPGDYMEGDIWYCGKCHTPKQCWVEFDFGKRLVSCQCECEEQREQEATKAEAARQKALYVKRLRSGGIEDSSLQGCRFEGATETPALRKCQNYVKHWTQMRETNSGLLLWGDTGTGKTFAAAAIANALIDRGTPVLVTSLPRVLNMAGFDKTELVKQMQYYPLVVLDDLGAEREGRDRERSDYVDELTYFAIDERYKAKKPLIVTTNLTLEQLCKPGSVKKQRIYDRVLEMCIPVACAGENLRRNAANAKRQQARALLEG